MGRGSLSKVRWRNDRIRKAKERDKRRGAVRKAAAAAAEAAATGAPAVAPTEGSGAAPKE